MTNIARLRDFVRCFTRLADQAEQRIFVDGRALLAEPIAYDDWLLPQFAASSPQRYQQYLLHCDRLERFFGDQLGPAPGQSTPLHDRTTICRCPGLCV